jgi:asparagine N-glycosylation enzyme membrane subunit Stt3
VQREVQQDQIGDAPGGLDDGRVAREGTNTFGITLLPMLIGAAMLFWNGRSALGWLLTVAGGLFILAGVIANLHIYFAPTSLLKTIVMLVLLVGGLALIARSRPCSVFHTAL